MRKAIYVVATVAIIALASFFISRTIFFRENTEAIKSPTLGAEPAAPQYISKLVDIPDGDTLAIGTSRGSVNVKNFYTSAIGAKEQFIIMKKNENYEINYDTYTSGFSVYVSASPFAANRQAAENDFLGILGISQADACKLKIFESAAPGIASSESSAGLPRDEVFRGLSFCGGAL